MSRNDSKKRLKAFGPLITLVKLPVLPTNIIRSTKSLQVRMKTSCESNKQNAIKTLTRCDVWAFIYRNSQKKKSYWDLTLGILWECKHTEKPIPLKSFYRMPQCLCCSGLSFALLRKIGPTPNTSHSKGSFDSSRLSWQWNRDLGQCHKHWGVLNDKW